MRTPLLLLCYLALWTSAAGGDDSPAAQFLDDKEALVQRIGSYALQNFLNAEALAETCGTISNCTRRVCAPLQTDSNMVCHSVPRNPDCQGPNNSTCTTTKVSWKQAFLLWSQDADLENEEPTCDMRATICAQRMLDEQIFLKNNESGFFVLKGLQYFGSANGLLRIYPGKERNRTQCTDYESRGRPWYVGATAVQKDIVVMLDSGPAMGGSLSLDVSNMVVFDASKNITLRLLDTLTQNDRVSVFTLGGATPSIVGKTLSVSSTRSAEEPLVFNPLKDQILGLENPVPSSSQKANLTAALITALQQFNISTQLKVVIIVTAGDMVGQYLEESLTSQLESESVIVFIFRLLGTSVGNGGGQDEYTRNLQNISCSLGSLYSEDFYYHQNPIGFLQPFYNYVARLRFDLNGQRPYWVPRYTSSSGITDVISVAYPVFNESTLVGIAAVDILSDNLGDISSDVTNLLGTRNEAFPLVVSKPPKIPCSQSLTSLAQSSCPTMLRTYSNITGLCTNVAKDADSKDLLCCSASCPWRTSSSALSGSAKAGVITSVVIGTVLGFGLLWVLLVYRPCEPRDKKGEQSRDGSDSFSDQNLNL